MAKYIKHRSKKSDFFRLQFFLSVFFLIVGIPVAVGGFQTMVQAASLSYDGPSQLALQQTGVLGDEDQRVEGQREDENDDDQNDEDKNEDEQGAKQETADGSSEIEIEHGKFKLKYTVHNGELTAEAEDEDGKDADLDDEKLEDEVEDELEEDGIEIASSEGKPVFVKNNIGASSDFPLTIDTATNQLVVTTNGGTRAVAILPDEAVNRLLATGIIQALATNTIPVPGGNTGGLVSSVMELKVQNGEPVYEVSGTRQYRLFALFPVTAPLDVVMSASTGQILATQKPFLTNIIDLLAP